MISKPHSHDRVIAEVPARLRATGLKVTKARVAMLEILTREHGPFTTEEIHTRLLRLRSLGPCDLVTVYRSLAKFESLGLISRCDFGDGTIRYELSAPDHHHHHIICRECKRIEPLPHCPFDEKSLRMPKLGFKNVSHQLEFFGVCPDCDQRASS